ncbi:MAG: L-histidine N(alpha)-methyltransferase [Pleurocapsa sp.]
MSSFSQPQISKKSQTSDRLQITYLLDTKNLKAEDEKDIIQGFNTIPKTIPPRYFYDALGSQLFEKICELSEYYPTRTEASILQQYAPEIIGKSQAIELIELGSGSSTKTRLLLDAYQQLNAPLYYTPIDVSGSILKESAALLLKKYPRLKIQGKVGTYSQALEQLSQSFLGNRMIVFLGSSIGNFNPQQCDRFLEKVTQALNQDDYFLLGIDLHKSSSILEAAYNDSQGITAAFNLNMLQHLNWRFQGNFDPNLFEHQAIYNQCDRQIEMYLISKKNQTVKLEKLNLTIEFTAGERILTEISRKFDIEEMTAYLKTKNLELIQSYTDSKQWFGLLLCQFKK